MSKETERKIIVSGSDESAIRVTTEKRTTTKEAFLSFADAIKMKKIEMGVALGEFSALASFSLLCFTEAVSKIDNGIRNKDGQQIGEGIQFGLFSGLLAKIALNRITYCNETREEVTYLKEKKPNDINSNPINKTIK